MMLKMSQKTRQTSRTLKMAGIAWISAFTTTCIATNTTYSMTTRKWQTADFTPDE